MQAVLDETIATVFIVDDEEVIRDSLSELLATEQIPHQVFSSGQDFLDFIEPEHLGCVLLDVRMPGIDGLAVQRTLKSRGVEIPVVILTGHADVPMVVQAMESGAAGVIQKPSDSIVLLDKVRSILAAQVKHSSYILTMRELVRYVESLTKREREVADLLVAGKTTNAIAADLGSSANTVKNQRSRILQKLHADSVADIVRIMTQVAHWLEHE